MLLLQQMIVLFMLMVIGYGIRKKEIIDDKGCKTFSWLVVNVANPAMIVSASVTSEKAVEPDELLGTFGIAGILFGCLIVISVLIPYLLRVEKKSAGVYRVMTIFSNIGFMGFPLINVLYGAEALVYASVFLIPFNLLIYTYGILALKPKGEEKLAIGKMFNIGTLSCVISVCISFWHPTVPDFIKTGVAQLSGLTAPLSMMVIGASLALINLRELFSDVRLLIFSVIKLLIVPIAGLFMFKTFIHSQMMLGICLVMFATPVASMTAMLAQQYDGDYELASKGVALSTILSVITMPIVSMITGI